ncbi:MAG: methionine synthase [Euryarchaeota archaeon RBG_16_62_10]|nr:MAG: methionine synthase [Euryarchaeota archaeon RBG_16_62_10]
MGNCVHIAGIQSFLELASSEGYETVFMGPAVPVRELVAAIRKENPEVVAVSYRLGPESAAALIKELSDAISSDPSLRARRFLFGGTPPAASVAAKTGLFEATFDGSEPADRVIEVLRGRPAVRTERSMGSDLVSRIGQLAPFPLLRHHFGLPSLGETIEGARTIAESGVLDILSIAPDQNAQESFFRPDEIRNGLDGAGGVPLRGEEDLRALFEATRTGNYPLLRCYSGTRDLVKWAEVLKRTIDLAWGAVPLTWYSELDGRSKRSLKEAIGENQAAIRWYAGQGIPVEVNESHQWALRRSGDTIEIATAYIAAYNAKALGVRDYVCQFMFDTPKGISPSMDVAKMLAKLEMVETLSEGTFNIIRMVRPGLSSFSTSAAVAKGQLASSVFASMVLKPHIVHVVGFSEADHAATPKEIVESCAIAKGAIEKALLGMVSPRADPVVSVRMATLLEEVKLLVGAVKRVGSRYSADPLTSPEALVEAVKAGLLDAADLKGNPVARGGISTKIVDGACVAVDRASGKSLVEEERIRSLASSGEDLDLAEI